MAIMIVDAALVARLEASSAESNAATSETFGAVERIGDGFMVALGPGRYINRTLGAGLGDLTSADMDRMAHFYREHGVPAAIEVTSWTPRAMIEMLGERGYRGVWFRNVYLRAPDTDGLPTPSPEVDIRRVDESMLPDWLETLSVGNEIVRDESRAISDEFARSRVSIADSDTFLAFLDGRPAGCGSLERRGGIGWTGGAATQPWCRGRGTQTALLVHRIGLAGGLGCDFVAATALPDGTSARNLMRLGFQLVYTQLVMAQPEVLSGHG